MPKPGPLFNLPGPAALRGEAERRRHAYRIIEGRVPARSLGAHAAGHYAPSLPVALAYWRYLGIPPHGWSPAGDLDAVGLGPDGKKLSEEVGS